MSYYSRESERMSDHDVYNTYNSRRRHIYPDTHQDPHPSEDSVKDYDIYHEKHLDAREATSAYNERLEKTVGPLNGRRPSKDDRRGYHKQVHEHLLSDAANAASSTLDHARARDTYLINHEYGYRNGYKRKEHDNYCDRSFTDANYYREAYDDHYEGSKAPYKAYSVTERDKSSYLYASDADEGRGRASSSSRKPAYEGEYEYEDRRASSRSGPRSSSGGWYDNEDSYGGGSYSRRADGSSRAGPSSGAYSSSY